MMENLLFLAGIAGAAAALLVLRISWSRSRRSVSLNYLGWLLLAVSLAAGWGFAGAWGVSVISLWTMGAAFVALGFAAWQSPPAKRAASNRRVGMLPEAGEPRRLGRRFVTFVIVVFAGMVAAIALAVASRWLAQIAGASEANANVLALFVAPLGWTLLAFLLLMTGSRKRQLSLLAVSVATALPALANGGLL